MSKILLVFEGERTEPKYFNAIARHFPFKDEVIAVFGGSLYQLYNKLNSDPDLDVFELIKERDRFNELENILRKQISEIFMIFDHDGHDSQADDGKIEALFEIFNDSTEQGQLYVSYPMVESLLDIDLEAGDYRERVALISENKKYKGRVHVKNPLSYNFDEITRVQWGAVIQENLKKANLIVTGKYEKPERLLLGQDKIYNQQYENYIKPQNEVAVLSAYPLFVDDYFRDEFLFYRNTD